MAETEKRKRLSALLMILLATLAVLAVAGWVYNDEQGDNTLGSRFRMLANRDTIAALEREKAELLQASNKCMTETNTLRDQASLYDDPSSVTEPPCLAQESGWVERIGQIEREEHDLKYGPYKPPKDDVILCGNCTGSDAPSGGNSGSGEPANRN